MSRLLFLIWSLLAYRVRAATAGARVSQVHIAFGVNEDITVSWSTPAHTAESCVEYEQLKSPSAQPESEFAPELAQRVCGSAKMFTDGGMEGYTQVWSGSRIAIICPELEGV